MKQIILHIKLKLTLFVLICISTNVFAQTNTVTDVLTATKLTGKPVQYSTFEPIQITSSAVYTGFIRHNANSCIQITDSHADGKPGIISTTSGGYIRKIEIVWHTNTTNGRALDIYGKNEEYTSTADLYTQGKQGELLGSIIQGTNNSITVTGNYKFIGLRSKSSVIYIQSISITYEGEESASKQNQTISFDNPSYTVNLTDAASFVSPKAIRTIQESEGGGSLAYTSSDESVATVDSEGNVSILKVGTTTITAKVAATEKYYEATASYTITVIDDSSLGINGIFALVGEKDGLYYALSSTPKDEESLSAVQVAVINGDVIKTEENKGTIQWNIITPDNTKPSECTICTIAEEKQYLFAESDKLPLSLVSSPSCIWTQNSEKNVWTLGDNRALLYSIGSQCFKNYAISNVGKTNYANYTVAMPFADGYTRTISEDKVGNIGTICLPNAVEATNIVGAKFYSIAGKTLDTDGITPKSLICQEMEGKLEAGMPYIFVSTSTLVGVKYSEENTAMAQSANGLIGAFTDTEIAQGSYIITNNIIQKCGTDCGIRANRAYINMKKVPVYQESNEAKSILEIGKDGTVGLNKNTYDADEKVNVYSISGLMLKSNVYRSEALQGLEHGLYIVGNKKVLVK